MKALQHTGDAARHGRCKMLGAVEAVNEAQKRVLVDKIVARLGDDLAGRRSRCGASRSSPNTDDMREAPSRVIIDALAARGARVVAYDPVAMDEARRVLGDAPRAVASPRRRWTPCDGADALVVVTEWKEFRSPDFDALARRAEAAARCSTAATCTSPRWCARRASNTSRSAAA